MLFAAALAQRCFHGGEQRGLRRVRFEGGDLGLQELARLQARRDGRQKDRRPLGKGEGAVV